jgi:superfamily II RNA helicase
MEYYQYKSLTETIEKLKEENEKLNQLKTEYHKKMLDYRMAYLKQNNKINEAIEYINNQMTTYNDGENCGVDCECDGFKLLDILKEVK